MIPASSETALLFGMPYQDEHSRLFNSAVLSQNKQVIGIVHKTLLPNYDVFDENRYFTPAACRSTIPLLGINLGVNICEDIWYDAESWAELGFPDPTRELMEAGTELLINISASPYHLGKYGFRVKLIQDIACRYGVPMVYVNQAGGNDDLIFDGSSLAVNSEGELAAGRAHFAEDFLVVDTAKLAGPVPPSEEDISFVFNALVLGLRDYCSKTGFKKAALWSKRRY